MENKAEQILSAKELASWNITGYCDASDITMVGDWNTEMGDCLLNALLIGIGICELCCYRVDMKKVVD